MSFPESKNSNKIYFKQTAKKILPIKLQAGAHVMLPGKYSQLIELVIGREPNFY
jgi:hypothetical protein